MIYLRTLQSRVWQNSANCKYLLRTIKATKNQKQSNRVGLAKLLKLKIGEKMMLTVNLDVKDCLINGQREILVLPNLFKAAFVKYM